MTLTISVSPPFSLYVTLWENQLIMFGSLQKEKKKLQKRERVERKGGWSNSRNKGIWTDRGRERQIINGGRDSKVEDGGSEGVIEAWMDLGERGWIQLERARGQRYAGERCEGGMKITQFVLSSCEKTEKNECHMKERVEKKRGGEGQRGEGDKGLKQVSGEQWITLSETHRRDWLKKKEKKEEKKAKRDIKQQKKFDAFSICLYPPSETLLSSCHGFLTSIYPSSIHPSILITADIDLSFFLSS